MPFLTFYTPTFRRPQGLARCLASVQAQTAVEDIEQIVIVDHVGRGVPGMYAQVPYYARLTRGDYVHFLADDDVLADPNVVERVRNVVRSYPMFPPVIIVSAQKGALTLPTQVGKPVEGQIDLGCFIVRGDLWRGFAGNGAYGLRYEGDYDFGHALWNAGHRFVFHPEILFVRGDVRRGAPE